MVFWGRLVTANRFLLMSLFASLRPALLCLAAALAAPLVASPILYYTPAWTSNGLGKPSSNPFTTAVTSAFGAGNVIEIASFDNTADFDDGAALFVNARQGNDSLSVAEQNNLLNFINAGGAVFFIGDHGSWTTWDNSFLSLFGDTFETWGGVGVASRAGSAPAAFASTPSVLLTAPGAIAGGNGTPLFVRGGTTQKMAALYGPLDNAIAFLDTNAFSGTTNPALYAAVGSWLFETASAYEQAKQTAGNPPAGHAVPDAMPVLAIAPVLFGFAWFRRRVRV